MYNAYTSSVLWSIRSKGFHDCSYLLPERSERYPFALSSSSSRCCCCCASSRSCFSCCSASSSSFDKYKASINPRFVLYGLRQSTLIQWPPFRRRLLVGGGDRFFDRFLGCEVDGDCCEVSCSNRKRYYGGRNVGARRNRGFRFRVSKESHECCDLGGLDDAEAMITLLSEEISEEWSCASERYRSSGSRIKEKKRVKYGGECRGGNVRRVEVEERTNFGNERSALKHKREEVERRERFDREESRGNMRTEQLKILENDDSEHHRGVKKNSGLENDLRRVYKLDALESRGETSRKNEQREARSRRAKSSSCSSYYSLSSSGEFGSDIEDLQDDNREKSEKKIVEGSNNELESSKEASEMHLRRRTHERGDGMSSGYHKQVYEEEENSNQAVALERRRRKQYSQTGGQVSESRRNHEEDTEIHKIHVNDGEMNSQNQKRFSGREETSIVSVCSDVDRENIQRSSQQLNERSGFRYTGEERVSQMQRQSKHSDIKEEDGSVARNSVQEIKEQRHQAEESMSRRAGLRGKTERFSEKSEIHDTAIRNAYLSHTENRIRNQEDYTSLVSGSQSEVKEQHYPSGQMPLQKVQSAKNSVYVSHPSDVIRVTESQRTSEKRIIGQESTITPIVQSGGETKESCAGKDSRVEQTNSRKEDQKAYGLLSSQEKVFEGASSPQSPLSLVSPNRSQQVNLDKEEIRDSQTILIPPSSQLFNRGSGSSYQTGGAIQDISYETSETGCDAAYVHPETGASVNSVSPRELLSLTTHGDALGSAHRSEQSSMQLIGEFVEKAKHEALISESQKEERNEKYQLKRRDSRQPSGGSEAKGPSDEMWVTDPSSHVTPQPGVLEGTAAGGHAIVKRGGRSLWSIIADIARLRWSPRAGAPDSAAKPAGKGSPDESVSSATWFSGHEHDGSSDDNAKGDQRVSLREAASHRQTEVGQISSRSQFESSGSVKLKQESGQHEVEISSSSSGRLEGGSASRHIFATSGDQSVGLEEVRSSQSHLPETGAVEVPLPLSARSLRRSPAVKEPSESGPTGMSGGQNVGLDEGGRSFRGRLPETDALQMPLRQPGRSLRKSPVVKEPCESPTSVVPGSSSLGEQVEQQPLSSRSHEETGSLASDSVLKQRKLQRNKQVIRDRFDEWEEAYRLEAEQRKVDEIFMREAIMEAKKAADIWEVPVGAVLVHEGKIIARGCNLVEELRDSTAHAEMICIREGSKVLHSWRLADTTLYVTLEPCAMCAGAILQARVKTLVWGAPNKLLGADGSWIRLFPGGEGNGSEPSDKPSAPIHPFHPKMTIRRGILESECAEAMQQFFQLRRKKKDKTPDKNLEPPTPPSCLPVSHHHPSKLLNKMHHFFHFMFCL